jgi:hypothetical protein
LSFDCDDDDTDESCEPADIAESQRLLS